MEKKGDGYRYVHGGYGFWQKKTQDILNFVVAFDLAIAKYML